MYRIRLSRTGAPLAAVLSMFLLSSAIVHAQESAVTSEAALVGVLTSDTSKAQKAIACKQLAVWGSAEAVPAVAALLPDAELTSWARIALEAIPGPAADAALRDALETTEGRTLVGVVNSIGVRRDPVAVDVLAGLLEASDPDVAEAAAVALGRIGTAEAAQVLLATLGTASDAARPAIAEGCILCAEQQLASGETAAARAIYDAVRAADVPSIRVVEATRGAILARGADGVPLLVEQLQATDRALLHIGLAAARELQGDDVTPALVAELQKMEPDRRALLILALADRGDAAALPAMRQAAAEARGIVRVAAIEALEKIGNAACIPVLLEAATAPDADVAVAAKNTLINLRSDGIDDAIAGRLDDAQGNLRRVLIELIGARRIPAVAGLLVAVNDTDAAIRQAALTALGETVELDQLTVLINPVVNPTHAADVEIAQQALRAAAVRMPDREACATRLTAAMGQASPETRVVLLDILAAMGGPRALGTVAAAARSGNRDLEDKASQLLGNWMSIDAAPVLLELAKEPRNAFRVRAIRGYIRIARQFLMSDEDRVAMCRNAMAAAERDAERQLVLEIAERYPSVEMLRLVVATYQRVPTLRAEATSTAMAIAQRVGATGDVQTLLADIGQKTVEIEIIKAVYGAGNRSKDVTETLKKHAGSFPLIAIPSSNYNEAFGGDPASGVVKQLTIDYRMDGKSGQAVFSENAPIVLPMP